MKTMKLIVELNEDDIFITESENNETKEKNLFIEGIFAQAELPNRNKRIYPKNILEKAIDEYDKTLVKTKRALGELNHPSCFLYNDFKVLGKDGWIPFDSVKIGDSVVCMDEKGNYVTGKVEKKIEQPFLNENVYHFKGRHIDCSVTENHRFYCLDRNDNIVIKTAKELYENSSHIRIIKNFKNYESNSESFLKFSGITKKINAYKNKENISKDLTINSKDFCKFFGFWLAEGYLSSRGSSVYVCQNSGKTAEEYKKILEKMGISYRTEIQKRKNNFEVIYFNDKRIYNFLKPLGNCYTKYIPNIIKNLSKDCLIELLEWYAKGDGRKVINGSEKRKEKPLNIFSTSKKLIEDFNEIILKIGFSGKIKTFITNSDYMFADRIIRKENKNPLYQLSISCTSGIHLDRRFIKIIKEHKNCGMAYCLTTNYGNFYVEDKGKQFLTGNSPSVDPANACILIESLKWNDNDVYGKAKVLTTPKGDILRHLINDGVKLGVSTRGLGSVKNITKDNQKLSLVESDYAIKAIDVVHAPSGIDCFVDGILEGVEYYYEKNILTEKKIEEIKNHVKKNDINAIQRDFSNFINKCRIISY